MTSICLLLSIIAMRSWPLYQLDIKNVFLHDNLEDEVYMWSNHLVLLIKGSLVWYVGYVVPYMA